MSGTQKTARASVTKIDGAPGSGKTYQLLQHVGRLRRTEDLKPWQMDFLTFSTAARADVEQRLKETFHNADPDDVEDAVSTVHGAALGQVIGEVYGHDEFNEQWELIDEDRDGAKFSRFFREEFPYINYDVGAKDPLKALERGEDPKGDTGNDIIAAYNFLRSKMWDYDAHQHAPVEIDEPPQRVTEIMRRWDEWKTENKYLQHDDYVHDAVEERTTPEYTDFLFIDEFQDLSPLQYKLYKIWRDEGDLRRIYIAGDADQSIYGFRGADPKYFRETDTDKVEPQKQSRRCPSDVVETANKALTGGGDMTPAREGGDVEHVTVSSSYGLAELVKQEVDGVGDDGKVYLLLRTNHYVAEVTEALRTEGVPYFGLSGHQRWRSPATEIYQAVRWLRGGERPELKAVIDALSGDGGPMRKTARRKIDAGDMDRDGFLDWFDVGSVEGFMSALDLKDWQFDMITSALRSDAEHEPRDVRVGTLHAAKGLEAESVILFPDYSQRMYERYQGDSQDEEERIFYVGASRASNRLRVAHGFFDGPEFPAFGL
jgi:superfamily I DNA/RNA helicase